MQKDYFLSVSSGTFSGVLSGELSGVLLFLARFWTGRLSSHAIMRCYTV